MTVATGNASPALHRRPHWSLQCVVRAFSLVELMVVTAIIGVLAAAGFPSLSAAVKRAAIEGAVIETATGFSTARDRARGAGVCVDYALFDPTPATDDRYTINITKVSCPGDPVTAPEAMVTAKRLSADIAQLDVQAVIGGVAGTPVGVVHFNRDGGIFNPVAEMRITGIYNGEVRRFSVYPAAGTIAVEGHS